MTFPTSERAMKYKEIKGTESFRPNVDTRCAHCLVAFEDEDDLGKCVLTEHYTHSVCVGHDH